MCSNEAARAGSSESLARDHADLSKLEHEDPALADAYRHAAHRVSELERQQRQLSSTSGHPLGDLMAPATGLSGRPPCPGCGRPWSRPGMSSVPSSNRFRFDFPCCW